MKEAVGESSMTILTIIIVALAISGVFSIVMTLVNHQGKRSSCENAGGEYSNGDCIYDGKVCTYDESTKEYNCG